MSFNAYARVEVVLRPGTTRDQVEAACRDFLDWRGYELLPNDTELFETGVAFDEAAGHFTLQITSQCPAGFGDDTFRPLVLAIGELALRPFSARLLNEDTSNDDSREYEVIAGPAAQLSEYKAREASYALEEHLQHISLPPGSTGDSMAELAARSCMTIATIAPASAGSERVARVAVDLTGMDLDETRRVRIARLATAIAREIAGQNGEALQLEAGPGAGAADWVLARTSRIGSYLHARSAMLADTANRGRNKRDPNGYDYNVVTRDVLAEVGAIEQAALARGTPVEDPADTPAVAPRA